jgi:PAS domain S-box-containing protein
MTSRPGFTPSADSTASRSENAHPLDQPPNDQPESDSPLFSSVHQVSSSEMAQLIEAFDWSQTPLGPMAGWPRSLKTMLNVCLRSRFQLAIYWGRDHIFLYNDAAREVIGSLHPHALGKPAREVLVEMWDTVGPMLHRVLECGEATWSVDRPLTLDRYGFSEQVYFTWSYSPIPNDTGGIGGVLLVTYETTERVLAERRLRTLREMATETVGAESVEQACATAMSILGRNSEDVPFALLYLLEATGSYTLNSSFGVSANPLTEQFPFESRSRDREVIEIDNLARYFGAEVARGLTKTALIIPFGESGLENSAGFLVVGVSGHLRCDIVYRNFFELVGSQVARITASARAREQERTRLNAIAELDRAKTAFFSNVSHEFRTPLTLMLGPLEEELREHPAPNERLAVVQRNALRLLKLVNALLDFSRIEAGRIEASYEPTDLAALTVELASVFRSATESAGLRFSVECPELLEDVYLDRDMWEKIVMNLLSNAFKFTFEGSITVTLRQSERRAELSVTDTGTGIPAGELSRIFERFHRIRHARARTHEGTGIGLALVQELVKLHGGNITVESVEGRGTTFTIAIPFGTAHLPKERIGAARKLASTVSGSVPFVEEALRWLPDLEPKRGASETVLSEESRRFAASAGSSKGDSDYVLLADDNADMRAYLRRLLSLQYDVTAVGDGEAVLRAVSEREPDLILADVMMPRLDGFGLVQRLRADPKTALIPIILLSARAGEEARVEGLGYGADDYLIKPFSARELLSRIHTTLKLARARKDAEEVLRRGNQELERRVQLRTREREDANEALLRSQQVLTTELDIAERLRHLATQLVKREAIGALYEQILDTAVAIAHSDFASIQMFYPERGSSGELRLLGHRGFAKEAAKSWEWVSPAASTAGAEAFFKRQRIVVPDVRKCALIEPSAELEVFIASGIVAMQTTPLLSRSGALLGVLSTHWRKPHELSASELRSLDILERLAADLIERSRGEEALRQAAEFQAAITSSMSEGLFTLDAQGYVTSMNPAAEQLFGWTFEEFRGRRMHDMTHYKHRDGSPFPIEQCVGFDALHKGSVLTGYEDWGIRKDGSFFDVVYSLSPISIGGQNKGVVVVFRDVTASKIAQAESFTKQKLESVGLLASGIAHDFNNILGAILAQAELAQTQLADGLAAQDEMKGIQESAVHGSEIVRQLMTYAGKESVAAEPVDISRLVEEMLELLKVSISKRVILDTDLVEGLPPVLTNPSQVRQVVMNLVTNAADALGDQEGYIRVTTRVVKLDRAPTSTPARSKQAYVRLEVSDTGPGIPPEIQDRIFDPFFTTKPAGHGLGLATVQGIVRSLGGMINLASEPGKGATFQVLLPPAEDADATSAFGC